MAAELTAEEKFILTLGAFARMAPAEYKVFMVEFRRYANQASINLVNAPRDDVFKFQGIALQAHILCHKYFDRAIENADALATKLTAK